MLTENQLKTVNEGIGDLHVTEVFSSKERLLTAGDIDTLRHADKVVFIVCHRDNKEKPEC